MQLVNYLEDQIFMTNPNISSLFSQLVEERGVMLGGESLSFPFSKKIMDQIPQIA